MTLKQKRWMKTLVISSMMIIQFLSFRVLAYDDTVMSISPSQRIIGATESFSIGVYCVPGQPIKSYECGISFDPSLLQANEVIVGDIFDGYSVFSNNGTINNTAGTISLIYGLIMGPGNVSDPGFFINISFTALGNPGTSSITLIDPGVTNESAYVPLSYSNGSVIIDAHGPTVSDESPSMGTTGDNFVFNISISDDTDEVSNCSAFVDWSHGSLNGNHSMIYAGGGYFTHSITLDENSVADLSYSFYTLDGYGNANTTGIFSSSISDNDDPQLLSDTSISSGGTGDSYTWYVNASDNIDSEDDLLVKINWTHGMLSENATMSYTSSYWTYQTILDDSLSDMSYAISIIDTAGNSIYTVGSASPVSISDNDEPMIADVNAHPSSQQQQGYVNCSATITDNINIASVFLNMTAPNGTSVNHTITSSVTFDTYYHNTTYQQIGSYDYYFFVLDSSGNTKKSTTMSFVISDISIPQITDVNRMESSPLDTDAGFGWINISGIISDDEINLVKLVTTNPDTSITNITMDQTPGGRYYLNSTFSSYGNYSYHIWANDTANNQNTSTVTQFSMPPNWDINQDGNVTVLDFTLISNHFNETGNPGWIREDVDNNGEIKVLDIVLAANNYGTNWW